MYGIVQDCSNCTTDVLGLLQYCTKPSKLPAKSLEYFLA